MKTIAIINIENATDEDASLFSIRNTARAIIFDLDDNVALMKVAQGKFHKVPGGGIDEGELPLEALTRECIEEAGVTIILPIELGLVTEIKKTDKIIQNSYCYIVSIIGEKKKLQLTDSEKENGFELLWLPLSTAINLVIDDGYSSLLGRYIFERELVMLKTANLIHIQNSFK